MLILFSSCSKEIGNFDAESQPTSQRLSCSEELNYTKTVHKFVRFKEPFDELTVGEKVLTQPKTEVLNYFICKDSYDNLTTEILHEEQTLDFSDPNYNSIVPIRSNSWRSINENGQTRVLDQSGNSIANLDSEIINFPQPLSNILKNELIAESDFERLIDLLGNTYQIVNWNQDIIVITQMNDGLKSEIFIDKRYQKEVAITHYNLQGEIEARRTFLYNLSNTEATLIGEVLETYKKSLDSERMMTIIELTEYNL